MKNIIHVLLAIALIASLAIAPALADPAQPQPFLLSVDGAAIEGMTCYNPDGALCLPLLPVAGALGYTVETSELVEGDAYRVVYTLTPAPADDGSVLSQLMVAFSLDDEQPSAVAISKDLMMLPLKQSMTLVDGEPYMPTEFFEVGMYATFALDETTNTLNIQVIDPMAN